MEPICYINGACIGAMGVWWFGFTKQDPAYKVCDIAPFHHLLLLVRLTSVVPTERVASL